MVPHTGDVPVSSAHMYLVIASAVTVATLGVQLRGGAARAMDGETYHDCTERDDASRRPLLARRHGVRARMGLLGACPGRGFRC